MPDLILLSVLICVSAVLYSSVGHAGASGYLAAMALVGVAPAVMKPIWKCQDPGQRLALGLFIRYAYGGQNHLPKEYS
jgi:hypothetical protein